MTGRAKYLPNGFTLIELMVTITVAVILMSVAVPSFQQLIANQRIKTTSFDLFSALNYARSEAVKRNGNVTLRAGASTDGTWSTGWRLVDGSGNLLRSWGPTTNLTVSNTATGAATTLIFGTDGRLPPGSVAPKLLISSSITLNGLTTRCIQLDLSGRPTTSTGACP